MSVIYTLKIQYIFKEHKTMNEIDNFIRNYVFGKKIKQFPLFYVLIYDISLFFNTLSHYIKSWN